MDCKIVEAGVVLESGNGGWNTEINKVAWFDKEPRWEIRAWNEDHTKCGKGVGLSEEALYNLYVHLEDKYSAMEEGQ